MELPRDSVENLGFVVCSVRLLLDLHIVVGQEAASPGSFHLIFTVIWQQPRVFRSKTFLVEYQGKTAESGGKRKEIARIHKLLHSTLIFLFSVGLLEVWAADDHCINELQVWGDAASGVITQQFLNQAHCYMERKLVVGVLYGTHKALISSMVLLVWYCSFT